MDKDSKVLTEAYNTRVIGEAKPKVSKNFVTRQSNWLKRQFEPEKTLKSCPFDNGKAQLREGDNKFFIQCMNSECGCSLGERYDAYATPDHQFSTRMEAVDAWNHRV